MSHQKGKTMQHEHSKSQQVKTRQRFWQAFIGTCQTTKARHPGKRAFHHPPAWQQDEAPLGLGQFDDFQAHPLLLSRLCRSLARVASIYESQLHVVSGHLLDGCGQLAHLRSILLIGRGDLPRQQMAQGINGQMYFAAFASLGSIIACAMPTFWTRWQRPAIKDGRRGLVFASLSQPQHRWQVMDHGFKHAGFEPSARVC
jgi:hypothetical protein